MKYISPWVGYAVGLVAVIVPAAVFAANASVSVTAPMSGKNYTVSGDLSTITFNGSEISATIAAGESLTITSPDKTIISFSTSNTPSFSETCGETYSVTFTNGTGGATKTFTVSPSSTQCGGGSSGSTSGTGTTGVSGSSGGGGGGGGSSTATAQLSTTQVAQTTPAPSTPVQVSMPAFSITSDLSVGSEGGDVTQLQTFLASDPSIYPSGLVTGYFGQMTQQAVRKFQEKYDLPAVGRVGPLTRAKLQEVFGTGATSAPSTTPTSAPAAASFMSNLALGSEDHEVTTLQTFLASDPSVYPEGLVTGYFGQLTQRAVKRFQEKYGIEAIGVVGPKTRAKLNELTGGGVTPVTTTTASAGDQATIEALQAQLKALQEQLQTLQGQ